MILCYVFRVFEYCTYRFGILLQFKFGKWQKCNLSYQDSLLIDSLCRLIFQICRINRLI